MGRGVMPDKQSVLSRWDNAPSLHGTSAANYTVLPEIAVARSMKMLPSIRFATLLRCDDGRGDQHAKVEPGANVVVSAWRIGLNVIQGARWWVPI